MGRLVSKLHAVVPDWLSKSALFKALFGQGKVRASVVVVIGTFILLFAASGILQDVEGTPAALAEMYRWMTKVLPLWAWIDVVIGALVIIYAEFLYREIRANGSSLSAVLLRIKHVSDQLKPVDNNARKIDRVYECLSAREQLPCVKNALERLRDIREKNDEHQFIQFWSDLQMSRMGFRWPSQDFEDWFGRLLVRENIPRKTPGVLEDAIRQYLTKIEDEIKRKTRL